MVKTGTHSPPSQNERDLSFASYLNCHKIISSNHPLTPDP